MKCSNCDTELLKGQKLCYKCRQKVELSVDNSLESAIDQFNSG